MQEGAGGGSRAEVRGLPQAGPQPWGMQGISWPRHLMSPAWEEEPCGTLPTGAAKPFRPPHEAALLGSLGIGPGLVAWPTQAGCSWACGFLYRLAEQCHCPKNSSSSYSSLPPTNPRQPLTHCPHSHAPESESHGLWLLEAAFTQ